MGPVMKTTCSKLKVAAPREVFMQNSAARLVGASVVSFPISVHDLRYE